MLFIGILVSSLVTLISFGAFIIVMAFMTWMMVDAAKQDRFWWVVIILGVPFIGSAAYYLTEKKHQYAKAPSHHIHVSETESQHEMTPKSHTHHAKHEKDSSHEGSIETKNVEETAEEITEEAQEKKSETV